MKSSLNPSRKKRKIIKDYNSSFKYYDQRYREIQIKKYDIFYNGAEIKGKRILDAGCGTGLLLEYMIQKTNLNGYLNYNYTGVDISLKMLNEFKLRLQRLGASLNVNLVLADIENVPFRENAFEKIFSITVFQNLVDIKKGLDEIIRVGKPELSLVISIMKRASSVEKFKELITRMLRDVSIDSGSLLEDIIFSGRTKNGFL